MKNDQGAGKCRSALLRQMLSALLEVPRRFRWLPRVAQTGLTFGGLVCEGPWGCNVQQQAQLLSISPGLHSGFQQTSEVFCLSGFNPWLSHLFFLLFLLHLHLIFTLCLDSSSCLTLFLLFFLPFTANPDMTILFIHLSSAVCLRL